MPLVTLERANTQVNGFSQRDKVRFLEVLQVAHGNPVVACDTIGISLGTFYNHVEADSDFSREVRIAKKRAAWELHTPLWQRAHDRDTTAAIWLQKTLNPDEFGDGDRRGNAHVVIVFSGEAADPTRPINVTPASVPVAALTHQPTATVTS